MKKTVTLAFTGASGIPYGVRPLECRLAAGAVIPPANPGFHHRPQSVAEVVDFIVARVLDQIGIGHELMKRRGE